jgi:NAD(P)-dependent dehydrogenase (short-subunit alcohol dehydrogenase family)
MGVVVITGCSTGLGLEMALAFGREGATVYATMRDTSKSGPLVDACARDGLRVQVVELDVTDDSSVEAAAARILDATGGCVDVLVNNAGIGAFGAVEDTDAVAARPIMETNFWGPFRMIQAFVPAMRARGAGLVVNVSSLSGRVPASPCLGFYAASKHALGAMSEALRYEVAGAGIRVLLVDLGTHRTNVEANLPDVDLTSPYAALASRVSEAVKQGVRVGADPADAAATIVGATNEPFAPFHLPVGADAIAAIAHYDEHGLAAWDQAIVAGFGVELPVN